MKAQTIKHCGDYDSTLKSEKREVVYLSKRYDIRGACEFWTRYIKVGEREREAGGLMM